MLVLKFRVRKCAFMCGWEYPDSIAFWAELSKMQGWLSVVLYCRKAGIRGTLERKKPLWYLEHYGGFFFRCGAVCSFTLQNMPGSLSMVLDFHVLHQFSSKGMETALLMSHKSEGEVLHVCLSSWHLCLLSLLANRGAVGMDADLGAALQCWSCMMDFFCSRKET